MAIFQNYSVTKFDQGKSDITDEVYAPENIVFVGRVNFSQNVKGLIIMCIYFFLLALYHINCTVN